MKCTWGYIGSDQGYNKLWKLPEDIWSLPLQETRPRDLFSPLVLSQLPHGATSSSRSSYPATSPLTLTNAPCRHTQKGTFLRMVRHWLPSAASFGRSRYKVTHTVRLVSMGAIRVSVLMPRTVTSWLLYPRRATLPPAVFLHNIFQQTADRIFLSSLSLSYLPSITLLCMKETGYILCLILF